MSCVTVVATQFPLQTHRFPKILTVAILFRGLLRLKGGLVMQIINIPNSMTVLPELLPYSIEMVRRAPAQPTRLRSTPAPVMQP